MAIDNTGLAARFFRWRAKFLFRIKSRYWPIFLFHARRPGNWVRRYPKSIFAAAVTVVLIWSNLPDFTTPTVVIENVTVPKDMQDAGLAPVIADEVRAEILRIDAEVPESGRGKRATSFRGADEKYNPVDIEVAGTKLDLRQLAPIIQSWLGTPAARVTAHIEKSDDGTFAIIQVEQPPYQPSDEPPVQLDKDWKTFGEKIAESALAKLKPAKLADHLFYVKRQPRKEVFKVLNDCIEHFDPSKKSDCLVEWGDIDAHINELPDAEKKYRAALDWNPESADAMSGLAWLDFDRGNIGSATKWLRKAERIDPQALSPHDALAEISLRMGDLATADSETKAALGISPNAASELAGRAWIVQLLGHHKEAAELLRRATAADPESTDVLETHARILMRQGTNEQADEKWATVRALGTNDSYVFDDWGRASYDLGDIFCSVEEYKNAITLNHTDGFISDDLAISLGLLGRFDDAYREFDRVIAFPGGSKAMFLSDKAYVLASQGRMQEAVDYWNSALQVLPSYGFAYQLWGEALLDRDDYKAAIVQLRKARKLQPSNLGVRLDLANALESLGKYEEEYTELSVAARISPTAGVLSRYAEGLAADGRLAEAEWMWNAANALDPDWEYYRNRGDTLVSQNDNVGAAKQYKAAIKLNPRRYELHSKLANCYATLDQDDPRADAEFKQAMEIDPGYASALADWGALLAHRGLMPAAQSKWDEALKIGTGSVGVYKAWSNSLPWDEDGDQAAIDILNKAVALNSRDPDLYRSLGNRLRHLGDRLADPQEYQKKYRQADAEFKLATSLNPGDIFSLGDWGFLLARRDYMPDGVKRDFMAEAVNKWKAALRINPTSPYVYKAWADALPFDRNNDLAAIADLQIATYVNPRDPALHYSLANRYANFDDPKADSEYRLATGLNPHDMSSLTDWGMFLAQQGRMSDAESKWSAAVRVSPGNPYDYRESARQLMDDENYQCGALVLGQAMMLNNEDITVLPELSPGCVSL